MTNPTIEDVKAALRENVEKVLDEVATSLAALGSQREWSMEDNFQTTEGIAMLADRCGLPSAGDQSGEDLSFWVTVARSIGLER